MNVRPTERPTADHYFAEICMATALRSTCPKAHVGAVIVINGYIASTGYNGSPIGEEHCLNSNCITDDTGKCLRVVHAEANAIISVHTDIRIAQQSTLYCTHFPCIECCKLIINAGIKRVCYIHEYIDPRNVFFLQQHDENYQFVLLMHGGIDIHHIQMEEHQ